MQGGVIRLLLRRIRLRGGQGRFQGRDLGGLGGLIRFGGGAVFIELAVQLLLIHSGGSQSGLQRGDRFRLGGLAFLGGGQLFRRGFLFGLRLGQLFFQLLRLGGHILPGFFSGASRFLFAGQGLCQALHFFFQHLFFLGGLILRVLELLFQFAHLLAQRFRLLLVLPFFVAAADSDQGADRNGRAHGDCQHPHQSVFLHASPLLSCRFLILRRFADTA